MLFPQMQKPTPKCDVDAIELLPGYNSVIIPTLENQEIKRVEEIDEISHNVAQLGMEETSVACRTIHIERRILVKYI